MHISHEFNHPHVLSQDLKEDYRQGTAALGEMDSNAPVPREAYHKLDSGVVYADLRSGSGEEVKSGLRVNLLCRFLRGKWWGSLYFYRG